MWYSKEDDWRISFNKCKPYIKKFNTALDVGARAGEFAYYLKPFKTVIKLFFLEKFLDIISLLFYLIIY